MPEHFEGTPPGLHLCIVACLIMEYPRQIINFSRMFWMLFNTNFSFSYAVNVSPNLLGSK